MGDFFRFWKVGGVSIGVQRFLLVAIYFAIFVVGFWAHFSWVEWMALLAPLYEEWLFRGIVLGFLNERFSRRLSIGVSAGLFGLWHLKNLGTFPGFYVFEQVFYAGLILGPVLGWLTLRYKTVWPGVFLHLFSNVILAPLSWWILSRFF